MVHPELCSVDLRLITSMSNLFQDIKFGLRLLLKDRSFTITALLTLAVCIGANAAMFSVVRSVLLKPLPFPNSDRVVLLYNSYPKAGAPRVGAAMPDYFDRLEAVPSLTTQALFRREGMTFGDSRRRRASGDDPRDAVLLQGRRRFRPFRGRVFIDEDGQDGQNRKVLLTYGFWQRHMAGARHRRRRKDPAQRTAVRRHWRPAGVVLISSERRRPVHARRVRAGRQDRQSAAQQQLADDRP